MTQVNVAPIKMKKWSTKLVMDVMSIIHSVSDLGVMPGIHSENLGRDPIGVEESRFVQCSLEQTKNRIG